MPKIINNCQRLTRNIILKRTFVKQECESHWKSHLISRCALKIYIPLSTYHMCFSESDGKNPHWIAKGKWTHLLTCKCLLLTWKSRSMWSMVWRLLVEWTSIHNTKIKKKKIFLSVPLSFLLSTVLGLSREKKNKVISLDCNAEREVTLSD